MIPYKHTNDFVPRGTAIAATVLFATLAHSLSFAQTAPAAPAATVARPTDKTDTKPAAVVPVAKAADDDEVVILSPFIVDATADTGYAAASTLGGTRLKSQLKDVASQIDVLTPELLGDIGALTLDEAIKYSSNIELAGQYLRFDDQDNVNSVNVFSSTTGSASRTRGLTRSNNTHDFFESNFPIDGYITGQRFTLVSGSNAILFGAGLAGGTNDASFERADLRKVKARLVHRMDSEDSQRVSLNVSVPLVKNMLAVRAAILRADENGARTGSGADIERNFATVTFQPTKKITIRAWKEQISHITRSSVTSGTIDNVTRWINNGKPLYNNLGITPALGTGSSADAPFWAVTGPGGVGGVKPSATAAYTAIGDSVNRFSNASAQRPTFIFNANGTASNVPVQAWTNTAISMGYGSNFNSGFLGSTSSGLYQARTDAEVGDRAILDDSIYPTDQHVVGNALQKRQIGGIKGFLFELNPFKNVFIEGGYNREDYAIEAFSFISGNDARLYVDTNVYLPNFTAGTTTQDVNPNVKKYYVEDEISSNYWSNIRDEKRLQIAFSHDPAPRGSWKRMLGRHQGAIMVSEANNRRTQQGNNMPHIISNNVIPGITGSPALVLANAAANQTNTNVLIPRVRYYLDPEKGLNSIQVPFDPFKTDTFSIGKDAVGNDIIVSRGINNPYGIYTQSGNGAKTDRSIQGAVNSSFWENRVITTLGKRMSNATFATWNGAALQPRYNALTGKYEVPVNGVFSTNNPVVNVPGGDGGSAGYLPASEFIKNKGNLNPPVSYNSGSTLMSVVVHPLGADKWLSLHYNKSDSKFVSEYTGSDPTGEIANIDDGETQEYGFSLRLFGDKISIKFNHYSTLAVGIFQATYLANSTGNASQDSNDLRWSALMLDKAILGGGLATQGAWAPTAIPGGNNPYARFMGQIQDWQLNNSLSDQFGDEYNWFHDRRAEGSEVTITANPTDAWTLRATVTQNQTKSENIGKAWFSYIDSRFATWKALADSPLGATLMPRASNHNTGTGNVTFATYLGLASRNWAALKQTENRTSVSEAKYRVRFNTAYSFKNGALKGFRVGGGVRYDSARAYTLYPKPLTAADNPYYTLPGTVLIIGDTNRPIYGEPYVIADGFISYKRKLSKDINWTCALNISNLLDNQKKLPTNSLIKSDGSLQTIRFNIPEEPRKFALTNTFEF